MERREEKGEAMRRKEWRWGEREVLERSGEEKGHEGSIEGRKRGEQRGGGGGKLDAWKGNKCKIINKGSLLQNVDRHKNVGENKRFYFSRTLLLYAVEEY